MAKLTRRDFVISTAAAASGVAALPGSGRAFAWPRKPSILQQLAGVVDSLEDKAVRGAGLARLSRQHPDLRESRSLAVRALRLVRSPVEGWGTLGDVSATLGRVREPNGVALFKEMLAIASAAEPSRERGVLLGMLARAIPEEERELRVRMLFDLVDSDLPYPRAHALHQCAPSLAVTEGARIYGKVLELLRTETVAGKDASVLDTLAICAKQVPIPAADLKPVIELGRRHAGDDMGFKFWSDLAYLTGSGSLVRESEGRPGDGVLRAAAILDGLARAGRLTIPLPEGVLQSMLDRAWAIADHDDRRRSLRVLVRVLPNACEPGTTVSLVQSVIDEVPRRDDGSCNRTEILNACVDAIARSTGPVAKRQAALESALRAAEAILARRHDGAAFGQDVAGSCARAASALGPEGTGLVRAALGVIDRAGACRNDKPFYIAHARLHCGEALLRLGQTDEALVLLDGALEVAGRADLHPFDRFELAEAASKYLPLLPEELRAQLVGRVLRLVGHCLTQHRWELVRRTVDRAVSVDAAGGTAGGV